MRLNKKENYKRKVLNKNKIKLFFVRLETRVLAFMGPEIMLLIIMKSGAQPVKPWEEKGRNLKWKKNERIYGRILFL